MAIGMAMQEGSWVVAYDENNSQLWSKSGELHGYTGSIVTIKDGSWLTMYDANGNQTGTRSC